MYQGQPWTVDAVESFWQRTHEERLEACASTARNSSNLISLTQKAEVQTCAMAIDVLRFYGLAANLQAVTMTGKIFRTASDDDTISWQEHTLGDLFLYYRDGEFRLSRLSHWGPFAQRTALSSFARASTRPNPGNADYISTPSCQVRYGDIPEPLRMYLHFPTIDSVVTAFYDTYSAPPDPPRRD